MSSLLLTMTACSTAKIENEPEKSAPITQESPTPTPSIPTEKTPPTTASTPEPRPSKLNLELDFYSQAPDGNWDYPWQEACEEASIALVANEILERNWNREEFAAELLRLVDWENLNFGAYEHTSVDQTAQMIREIYGLQTVIHENPTFEDLQKILSEGHFIVAPFAGKLLENPYFSNGGPTYHMMVLHGYKAKKEIVITHDVGTRRGEDFEYSWENLEAALHDWDDSDILQGKPRFIEVF